MQRHVFWALIVIGAGLVMSLPFRRPAELPVTPDPSDDLTLVQREQGDAAPGGGADPGRDGGERVSGALALTEPATSPPSDPWSPPPLPNPFPGAAAHAADQSNPAADQNNPGKEHVPARRVRKLERMEPPPESEVPARQHRVVDGDSLPNLAEKYLGAGDRWRELLDANRRLLSNPDVLPIGALLNIPSPSREIPGASGAIRRPGFQE